MSRKKKHKHIDRICNNCKLYDPGTSTCSVVVLHEGNRYRLPVLPKDPCFFEKGVFDPKDEKFDDFAGDIKQVRFWVENEKGQKTDKDGTVKMEYPEGFFGDKADDMFSGLMNDPDIRDYLQMLREIGDTKRLNL